MTNYERAKFVVRPFVPFEIASSREFLTAILYQKQIDAIFQLVVFIDHSQATTKDQLSIILK